MWCRSKHTTLRCAFQVIKPNRISYSPFSQTTSCRETILTQRNNRRLSRFWIPTGGITSGDGKQDDATAFLLKAGFIRQSQSGIFQYLPLAEHVESRLKQVLQWHLESNLGASKVSLSSLSTEELWRRSGRIGERPLQEVEHQFLTVRDRKDSSLILSPTHEEEITTLVANNAKSYKDFPLRLYQIGRKYRDELRPRHGLLRTKEFMMKDLYTFDISEDAAIKTYDAVRETYRQIFKRLGLPVVEAKASSGDMGGSLSHEFHILSDSGEDTLHICTSCGFAENEEVSRKLAKTKIEEHSCPQCDNKAMTSRNAIEIGHTFHLGTRYSEPLGAVVEVPEEVAIEPPPSLGEAQTTHKSKRVPLQMGCHGIGVSRLIGATASLYADKKGLRWPITTFPIGAMIIFDGKGDDVPGLEAIHISLSNIARRRNATLFPFRTWIDDRPRSLVWKLKDADLVGYPLVIVLGRKWLETGEYEIRCRFDPTLSVTSKDLVNSVRKILNTLDPDPESSKQSCWWATKTAMNFQLEAAKKHPLNLAKAATTTTEAVQQTDRLEDIQTNPAMQKVVTPHDDSASPIGRHISANRHVRSVTLQRRSARPTQQSASTNVSPQQTTDSWMPALHKPAKRIRAEAWRARLEVPTDTPRASEHIKLAAPASTAHGSETLSREHLLEKVQLLERLFALQDKEKEIESKSHK